MGGVPDEVTYFMSVDEFDTSLLPAHARTPGTDAFAAEVSKVIQQDFAGFRGLVQIVVDKRHIRVHYRPDPEPADLIDAATQRLKAGNYPDGIRLLRLHLGKEPDDPVALFNLGMALSDTGALAEAERHLRRVVALNPPHVDAQVALGVALARGGRTAPAIEELTKAIQQDPSNSYAHRNLGGCLLKTGRAKDALEHLRLASRLKPDDAQAWYGVAQAAEAVGERPAADEALRKVIDLEPRSPLADAARVQLTRYAGEAFRERGGGVPRMDAVMYLLGAMQKFEGMTPGKVGEIGFEIAALGRRGLDMNDPAQKYTLNALPGRFSGLHLVCLMYAAFKIVAPEADVGIDLSREYETAKGMGGGSGPGGGSR